MSARRFDPPPALVVDMDARGGPARFVWHRRVERVVEIEAIWEEQEGWWRGADAETTRRCHRVRSASGLRCLLYHQIEGGAWTLGAILD